jgi:hypothetical protein
LLAGGLVVFVTFIPFFAFRELGRVYGKDELRALFFLRRDPASTDVGQKLKTV